MLTSLGKAKFSHRPADLAWYAGSRYGDRRTPERYCWRGRGSYSGHRAACTAKLPVCPEKGNRIRLTALGKAVLPPLLAARQQLSRLGSRLAVCHPVGPAGDRPRSRWPALCGCGRSARCGAAQSGAGGEAADHCGSSASTTPRPGGRDCLAADLSAATAAAGTERPARPAPGGTGQRPRRPRFRWKGRFRFRGRDSPASAGQRGFRHRR